MFNLFLMVDFISFILLKPLSFSAELAGKVRMRSMRVKM